MKLISLLQLACVLNICNASYGQITVNLHQPRVDQVFPDNGMERIEGNPHFDAFILAEHQFYFLNQTENGWEKVKGVSISFDPKADTSFDIKQCGIKDDPQVFVEFATDLDQDGKPDVLLRDLKTRTLYGCIQKENGVFGKAHPIYKSKAKKLGFYLYDTGSEFRTLTVTEDYQIKKIIGLNNFPEIEYFKVKSTDKCAAPVAFSLNFDGTGEALFRKDYGWEYVFTPTTKKQLDSEETMNLGDDPALYDLDQDGFTDIIAFRQTDVFWRRSEKGLGFSEEMKLFSKEDLILQNPEAREEYLDYWEFVFGDFNGDHRMDIIAHSEYLVFLMQQEDGSFKASLQMDDPYDSNKIWIGDLDKDGDRDVMIDSYYGINVLENENGNFETTQVVGNTYIQIDFFSDENNDGMKDIFVIERADQRLYWYESQEGKYLDLKLF